MKSRSLIVFVPVAGFLMFLGSAFAHHGNAAYRTTKLTTLKGIVTDYQLMNPHTEIWFDVNDATGKTAKWVGEAGGVMSMSRKGWTRNLLKPGDPITVVGNCAINDSNTMRLLKIILSDGKEYLVDRAEDYAN